MNSKPTILVSENRTVFQTLFLEELWEPYFNVEIIDLNKNYDKSSTVVVSDWGEFRHKQNLHEQHLENNGVRHIIDHCWDSWDSQLDNKASFVLRPRDFIRINESIWYKHLGYNKLELHCNPACDFLLLMNLKKPWRTKLYNKLTPVLPNNIYSYVEHGIPLQNAQDCEYDDATWERYINPDWYTSTRFSIISESFIESFIYYDSQGFVQRPPNLDISVTKINIDVNVSEKTYKPCAFKHPFIVWGQPGILNRLHEQGFETFDHCVDESYDTVEDVDIRLEKVVEQINRCIADKTIFADPLTKQKLEHNYNHFYNEEVVMKLFKEQMVDPLLEFIES